MTNFILGVSKNPWKIVSVPYTSYTETQIGVQTLVPYDIKMEFKKY